MAVKDKSKISSSSLIKESWRDVMRPWYVVSLCAAHQWSFGQGQKNTATCAAGWNPKAGWLIFPDVTTGVKPAGASDKCPWPHLSVVHRKGELTMCNAPKRTDGTLHSPRSSSSAPNVSAWAMTGRGNQLLSPSLMHLCHPPSVPL